MNDIISPSSSAAEVTTSPLENSESEKPTRKLPSYAWTKDPNLCQDRIKALTRRAFPQYRGRKFILVMQKSYQMSNYWDGGTRSYPKGIDLSTDTIVSPRFDTTNPSKAAANAEFDIPPGFAILEMCIFCGKNVGIRLYLPPLEPLIANGEVGK